MLSPPDLEPDGERPVGEIVQQLLDEGKAYARAEIGLAKTRVQVRAERWKLSLILFALAACFAFAAIVTLCVTMVMALATLVGPLAGGLIATLVTLGVAGGLAYVAAARIKDKP